MPARKLIKLWPQSTLLKQCKRGERFVLKDSNNIIKVYTHKAWRPFKKHGYIEFTNTQAFTQARISSHRALNYYKFFDFKTFHWLEVSAYRHLDQCTQCDHALRNSSSKPVLDATIRLFCDIAQKGFFHTDTNAANILIHSETLTAFIIDIEEIVHSPSSATDSAALMTARFYNESVSEVISPKILTQSVNDAFTELKWGRFVPDAVHLIKRFGNKKLTKSERSTREQLIKGI